MLRFAVLAVVLALSAGCGGDEGANGTASPTNTEESATATGDAVQTGGASQSPAPTVRAFLSAYQAGAAARACAFVGKGFSNPRDRTLRNPAYCRKSESGRNDVLAQDQQIVASDPKPPRARVITLNAKRTQLLFELQQREGRWRLTLVKPIGRLAQDEDPKLPAP